MSRYSLDLQHLQNKSFIDIILFIVEKIYQFAWANSHALKQSYTCPLNEIPFRLILLYWQI